MEGWGEGVRKSEGGCVICKKGKIFADKGRRFAGKTFEGNKFAKFWGRGEPAPLLRRPPGSQSAPACTAPSACTCRQHRKRKPGADFPLNQNWRKKYAFLKRLHKKFALKKYFVFLLRLLTPETQT